MRGFHVEMHCCAVHKCTHMEQHAAVQLVSCIYATEIFIADKIDDEFLGGDFENLFDIVQNGVNDDNDEEIKEREAKDSTKMVANQSHSAGSKSCLTRNFLCKLYSS